MTRAIVIGVGLTAVAGLFAAFSISRRRTKLTLVDGVLTFTGLVGERVLCPARIVTVEVAWGGPSRRRSRLWLLLNTDGHAVASLNRDAWDRPQLEGLERRLDLPTKDIPAPQSPAELREACPGVIPWWGAHPYRATLLAIFLICAVTLAVERLAW